MKRIALVIAGALIGLFTLAHQAQAALVSISTNIVEGGVTFSFVKCLVNGVNCSSSNDNLEWEADGSPYGVTITTTSGVIVTGNGTGGQDVTLIYTMLPTVPGHGVGIKEVGLTIAGSNGGSSLNNSLLNVGETLLSSAGSVSASVIYGNPEQYLTVPGGLNTTGIQVTKDIQAKKTTGATIDITSVNQDFVAIPEPASAALVVFGMAATLAMRRRQLRKG